MANGDSDGSATPPGSQGKSSPSNGKPGSNIQSSAPQQDSNGGNGAGPGQIDIKRAKELIDQWGKLPARDRESNMRELVRDMDPRYREIIMEYFRKQSIASANER